MTSLEALLVLVTGFGAGVLSSTVGVASLLSFPVLVALGLPPVVANVTNTLGLILGGLGGVVGYRTEVREAQEGFAKGQTGSSSMPHKKNPIASENISGLARLLRSNLQAGLENVALWHERDISHSSAERLIFPDATGLLAFMLRDVTWVLDGLRVFPDRMRENSAGRMGGAGWGSEQVGGSSVDRRPPDQDTGDDRRHA